MDWIEEIVRTGRVPTAISESSEVNAEVGLFPDGGGNAGSQPSIFGQPVLLEELSQKNVGKGKGKAEALEMGHTMNDITNSE